MDIRQAAAALRAAFEAQLKASERGAAAARDEATNTESKAENQYDTRSLEASYLARGQAERVAALRSLVGFFRGLAIEGEEQDGPAGLGRLVQLEDEDEAISWWFIASGGGGSTVAVGDDEVRVLTPQSPLGRALCGAWVDDDVEAPNGRVFTVLSIQG